MGVSRPLLLVYIGRLADRRLVYRLYQSSLPWTGGGEYLAFYRLVKRLAAAWNNVGLDPVFVFDGM